MSRKIRKAMFRGQRRQREIRRHFQGVKFCPKCGAVVKYVQGYTRTGYVCPNCGPVDLLSLDR